MDNNLKKQKSLNTVQCCDYYSSQAPDSTITFCDDPDEGSCPSTYEQDGYTYHLISQSSYDTCEECMEHARDIKSTFLGNKNFKK